MTTLGLGDWLNAERLQRSQELLETADSSIESVTDVAGFQSLISFRQSFKAKFSVSPSVWHWSFRGPVSVNHEKS